MDDRGLPVNQIICGNNLEVISKWPTHSIEAIVTDPPYGIDFMGKGWDHQVLGVEYWKAFRRIVMPGGYLFAFGGTRLFHRLSLRNKSCLSD